MRIAVCGDDGLGLVLKGRDGIVRIAFTRLEYVEVVNKIVSFHFIDGMVHKVTAALADLEEKLLSRPEFLKVHRSYLVNLNYVQAVRGNSIVTNNGHTILVARQRLGQVQDAYMHFLLHKGEKQPDASPKKEREEGPWRILLVDDEPADRMRWADILCSHGCIVRTAAEGEEALAQAADGAYDCVLLDVMLPGEDGFSLCKKLYTLTQAPVIFLSSFTGTDKQVKGFEAGGTDYITKDTPAELFWAKVETRIRLAATGQNFCRYGRLLLDLPGRRAFMDEKELVFTPVEFDLLQLLSKQAGHIFTPEELFGQIWGGRLWDGGQTVQIHMSRLRRKLEKACEEHSFIETVWGQGYRFVLPDCL